MDKRLFFIFRISPSKDGTRRFGLCHFHLTMFALWAAARFITTSFCRPSVIRRLPCRENDSPLESKTITVAVSQAAPSSSRLCPTEYQLFLKLVSPPASPASHPLPPLLAVSWRCWPSYRCWPVVLLFEMCSPRLKSGGKQ